MPVKLSVKLCRNARSEDRERLLSDSEVRGLALRVHKSGVKSWIFQWSKGGRVQKVTLGRYEDLSLDQARTEASAHRDRIRLGNDPAAERRAQRAAWTVRDLWRHFEDSIRGKRAASTRREYEMVGRLHVLPAFGSRRPDEVAWSDVARLHAALGAQGSPVQGNRVLKCGARVWDLGAKLDLPGLADRRNPFRGHDRHPERATAGKCYSRAELRAIGEALRAEPKGSIQAVALWIVFLSGMRPAEVVGLRWQDLSENLRIVRLPESKTGPRVAYLGKVAAELLAGLPRVSEYAFPSRLGAGPMGDCRYTWDRVREAAEVSGRLYDARHTFTTTAEESLGIPRERVMKLVGHSPGSGGVHGGYVHTADLRLLADADRVAEFLHEGMSRHVTEGEVLDFAEVEAS